MHNASTTHRHIEQTVRYLSMIADMAAEKANEGIAVVDLDGSLLFVNEAWCEMHGYKSKDELIGKQLSIFHTKEQMKTNVIPLLAETRQSGRTEGTIGHIKSNGTVFVTQTEMISVGDGTGKAAGFIVFAANISQSLKLRDMTVYNLKQIKHLSERIAQLRSLFGEFRQIGECLAERTNELRVNNEMLLKQISELDRSAGVNPEQRKPKAAPAKKSEYVGKSKRSVELFNTKEFEKVAELARRLSELSNCSVQSKYKDIVSESEQCSIKTKSAK